MHSDVAFDIINGKLDDLSEIRAMNRAVREEIKENLHHIQDNGINLPIRLFEEKAFHEEDVSNLEVLNKAIKRERDVYQELVMVQLELRAHVQEITLFNRETLKVNRMNKLSRETAAAIHVANVWIRPFRYGRTS